MASLGRGRDGKSSILEKPLSRGKSEVTCFLLSLVSILQDGTYSLAACWLERSRGR